jgi:hypothetical protein
MSPEEGAGTDVVEDGARRLDVFVHIPKTAGTTLKRILTLNDEAGVRRIGNVFKGFGGWAEPNYEAVVKHLISDPRARVAMGHVPLGIRDHLPDSWIVRPFAFLREPVDRALSHYFQIVETERVRPRYVPGSRFDAPPVASITSVPYTTALSHGDFVIDNLQTRMLSGDPRPFGEVDEAMLERALHNLERLTVFGVAERFDESVVLLHRRLGYEPFPYVPERVSASRPRGGDMPADLRDAAVRANVFDARLYEQATALFDDCDELRRVDVRIDVEALSRARTGTDRDDPPAYFEGSPEAWGMLLTSRIETLHAHAARLRAQRQAGLLEAAVESITAERDAARLDAAKAWARVEQVSAKLQRIRSRNRTKHDPTGP